MPLKDFNDAPTGGNVGPEEVIDHVPSYKDMLNDRARWAGCRVMEQKRLSKILSSNLFIDTKDLIYRLSAAPVEIYSAGFLVKYEHWRETKVLSLSDKKSTNITAAQVVIPAEHIQFCDPNDVLHVARLDSPLFQRHTNKLNGSLLKVMRFVMQYGSPDSSRRQNKGRVIDIGVQPELEVEGEPLKIYGEQHFAGLHPIEKQEVLSSIGAICDLIWSVMCDLQSAGNHPILANNSDRNDKYSRPLRKLLNASIMMAEAITLVHMLCFPWPVNCISHVDKKNCKINSYSKTGCLSIFIEDGSGMVHLFQVILIFRSSAANIFFLSRNNLTMCRDIFETTNNN